MCDLKTINFASQFCWVGLLWGANHGSKDRVIVSHAKSLLQTQLLNIYNNTLVKFCNLISNSFIFRMAEWSSVKHINILDGM